MGWVTMTLRKQTLKVEHNNYELQLLQISSQRRAMARGKQAKLASLKSSQAADIAALGKGNVDSLRANYQKLLTDKADSNEIAAAQLAYTSAKEDYQQQQNDIKEMYSDMKEDLEAEATEQENELDEEQTELESIIESISQELQSVSQQISTDIQTSTIQLK